MKHFIILSYPRSGNTWLRYVIEYCFNIRTYGYNSIIDIAPLLYTLDKYRCYDQDFVGHKRHGDIRGFHLNTPMIYIERNKSEVVQSQQKHLFKAPEELWHLNKEIYDGWMGKKMMIRYDSLMNDVNSEIDRLCDFFEKEHSKLFEDENFHRERCKQLYELSEKSDS